MIGKTLNHYEIIESLGAGGMGEVYRARDTKLARDVAVKVLPPHLADDSERLARMQREAQLLAALNHPNIAAIYGLEDAGGVPFLAMELAEGQTLAQRLADGALSVDEALKIALQIAEALESAHEAGIVHRDLKPANVQVATEGAAAGQVKVLDFGLAKAYEPDGTTSEMSPDLSASPTMAAAATATGMIMGTAAYMSPEQARGKPLDKRTDIWAFGCVVFEMLTGKRAFQGETVTDILAAIVHQEPQWEALPPETPLRIRELLARCLKKQAEERLRDVGECRISVREYLADPEGEKRRALASAGAAAGGSAGIPWTLAAPAMVAVLAAGSAVTWLATRPEPPPPGLVARFDIELPDEVDFSFAGNRFVAVSPDGSRIAFVADRQLWMRQIGELAATPIPGTFGSRSPFFSPDGEEIGFFTPEPSFQFKRVSVAGGTPIQINDVETQGFAGGASWSDNGMIYFGQNDGIWQVPAASGTPERIMEVDDGRVWGPQLLPGGEWVLFTLRGADPSANRIVAQSLDTDDRIVLVPRGTDARWLPTGHLVYALDGTLLAVPFDPSVMRPPVGAASTVAGIRMSTNAAANYGVAQNGTLVFVPGTTPTVGYQLAWVHRNGTVEPLPHAPSDSRDLDLSPDGQRIAVVVEGDDGQDIWIYDTERGDSRVLLTTEGNNRDPVWSSDGEWVFFSSDRGGDEDIWKRRADRRGDAEMVLDTDARARPEAISANGEMLLFTSRDEDGDDVGILALEPDAQPEILIDSPANERPNDFSPDGRFFAYMSDETGQYEVSVMEISSRATFPVSTSDRGGAIPRWSRNGEEIFYSPVADAGILVVGVDTEQFQASEPVEVSDITRRRFTEFDVTEDGLRFLVTTVPVQAGDAEGTPSDTPRIRVILNWFEELKRLVPTGR